MTTRGKFITVEGLDGAGKSSHLQFIADTARAAGRQVLVTREPGGTPVAEVLRTLVLGEDLDPLTETLLMFAARSDHLRRVIRPALEQGVTVVCDRFSDATLAYQGGGKGVPEHVLQALIATVHPGLAPDRTFVFDCSPEVARVRLEKSGRALDRFETEGLEFFQRVRWTYLTLARAEPRRILVIDASFAFEAVRARLADALQHMLEER
jgi:dTMP kinase